MILRSGFIASNCVEQSRATQISHWKTALGVGPGDTRSLCSRTGNVWPEVSALGFLTPLQLTTGSQLTGEPAITTSSIL